MKLLIKKQPFRNRKELFDERIVLGEFDKFGLAVFKHRIIFETAGFN